MAGIEPHEKVPELLLIVREELRPGSGAAYEKNELKIAAACARWQCPHPYLALASVAGPKEVWWLNAFASQEEKDQLGPAYARNQRLMAQLQPLGKRKEAFRRALTTTLTTHRPELSRGAVWRVAGARFFVVNLTQVEGAAVGPVFESSDGQRFVVASAVSRAAADRIAASGGPGSVILAVQPQWSFPAPAWIAADPDFWKSNPFSRRLPTASS